MSCSTVPALVAAAAERFGDATALVTRAGSETFAELGRRVAAAAGALRSLGVGPGDRVLLVAESSPAAVHVWLGAIHAGALPAAVNPELTLPELRYLAADLAPALIVCDEPRRPAGAALSRLAGVPACGLTGPLERGGGVPPHPADPLAPAAIVYTSGTTSRPKGVLVRHAAYTETGGSFPGWIGLGPRERLWACLPLFHINAQAYSLMSALAHGHALALTPKFHASTFWRDAAELEVTSVNVVGAMLAILARQPAATWAASPLRTVYAAPAPPPGERRELEARFHVRITGGYGMSENTFGCVESPTSRDRAGCVGRPRQPASGAFVNEMRIVVPGRGEAAPGEVGELWFRSPVLTPGYWNAPEATAAAIVDGWLRTGDAGRLDGDGEVTLAGRYKEMIRRRGENISPAEVEDVLLSHPAVAAAAVFGVPSELTEEEVVAAVVPSEGGPPVTGDELRAWAARSLAAFKVPSRIVFRDALPMTPTHRVARDVLRAECLAGPVDAPPGL